MHLQDKEKVLKYHSIVKFSSHFLSLHFALSKKKYTYPLWNSYAPYTFTCKESPQMLIY